MRNTEPLSGNRNPGPSTGPKDPGRRALAGAGIAAVLAGFLSPAPGLAQADAKATALIDRMVADLNRIINSGKSESAMIPEFEALFSRYGDVPIIARSALGVAWRGASARQRKEYVAAFRTYMARKYGKRFREFIGGRIVVTGTRKTSSGYLVSSVAYLAGEAPFEVDWQVSDKSGQDKMFNMFIEGISLLATERTEIGAMLDKRGGDLDRLIRDLKKAG